MRRQPIWVFVFALICTFGGCTCNFDGKCSHTDHLGCCQSDSDCSVFLGHHRYCVKSATSSLCFDCRNNDDCPSSTPICDAIKYTCRECNPDRERCPCNENKRCESGLSARVCLLDKGYCVGCESESDCRQLFSGGPHCNADTQLCEACPPEGCSCASDADCYYIVGNKRCLDGACVQCNGDEDCPPAQSCDERTHSCQSGCGANADCPSESPVCKEGTGLCVKCMGDGDCLAERPYCDLSTNTCQPCLSWSDDCGRGHYCAQSSQGYDCISGCKNDDDCMPIVSPPDLGGDDGDGMHFDAGLQDAFGGDAQMSVPDSGSMGNPPPPRCDTARHTCVVCTEAAHCPLGEICKAGECIPGCTDAHGCPGGLSCCGGVCSDTRYDSSNCGACGDQCASGTNCCDSECIDWSSDTMNCTGCGQVCSFPHAIGACKYGCVIDHCEEGWADCDGERENGCEHAIGDGGSLCH